MGDWSQEKQSQTKPILFSPQIFWGLKTSLKKQTQFLDGQIVVMLYLKENYGNITACGPRKTNPIRQGFR